ncbi:hypothetical protein XENOCAPTIV_003205, partial [Xenoophorus captivus]
LAAVPLSQTTTTSSGLSKLLTVPTCPSPPSCFPHFQSGPRTTLAPTPSIIARLFLPVVIYERGSHKTQQFLQADAAESQLSWPPSLLRERQEQPCNDLAGLEFQHFDQRPVTLFGKSSESWAVRFGSGAVSGAGLQRSLHLLLFNFCCQGRSVLTPRFTSNGLCVQMPVTDADLSSRSILWLRGMRADWCVH